MAIALEDAKLLVLELVQVTVLDVILNVLEAVIQHVLELVQVTVLDVMHNVLVDVILDVQVIVKVIVSDAELVLDSVVLCAQQHVAENV